MPRIGIMKTSVVILFVVALIAAFCAIGTDKAYAASDRTSVKAAWQGTYYKKMSSTSYVSLTFNKSTCTA